MIYIKDGKKIDIKNSIQESAFKSSGWVEYKPKQKPKKTEEEPK